jgi:hypothetical protein
MFENIIAVIFQNIFYAEIYQNDIFFIFKKLFLRLAHQNDLKHTQKLFLVKKI